MVELSFNCPENVGDMSPTNKGRFCDSCHKDIVDYTEMSNDEIREQLKRATGKTCGIFKKRQIMNSNRIEIGSRFRMAFMMVFLLGMSSTDMFAQDTLTTLPLTIQSEVLIESTCIIRGKVVDNDTVGVPFVMVWIDLDTAGGVQKRIYAKTDIEGNYKLSIPETVTTPVNLYAQSIGYDTTVVQGITFTPFKNEVEVEVTLIESSELHWVGIIFISPPYIPKDPYEIGKTTLDGEDIRQWD